MISEKMTLLKNVLFIVLMDKNRRNNRINLNLKHKAMFSFILHSDNELKFKSIECTQSNRNIQNIVLCIKHEMSLSELLH